MVLCHCSLGIVGLGTPEKRVGFFPISELKGSAPLFSIPCPSPKQDPLLASTLLPENPCSEFSMKSSWASCAPVKWITECGSMNRCKHHWAHSCNDLFMNWPRLLSHEGMPPPSLSGPLLLARPWSLVSTHKVITELNQKSLTPLLSLKCRKWGPGQEWSPDLLPQRSAHSPYWESGGIVEESKSRAANLSSSFTTH